jgi:hypothetical protein
MTLGQVAVVTAIVKAFVQSLTQGPAHPVFGSTMPEAYP